MSAGRTGATMAIKYMPASDNTAKPKSVEKASGKKTKAAPNPAPLLDEDHSGDKPE